MSLVATTIVVTGASGFIGRALVSRLLGMGNCSMRLVSHTLNFSSCPRENTTVHIVENFSDSAQWAEVLRGADVLVHLAGRAHVLKESTARPELEFNRINVEFTEVLARAAVAHGVKRLVFVSSIGVNGLQTETGKKFSEICTPKPENTYARSKWAAEQLLVKVAQNTGMEVVIVRPPLVYGENAPGNFGALMRAIAKSWPLPLGAVNNLRSFVSLDNLVDFLILCLKHPRAANQTFLVSDGQDVSTTWLVRFVATAMQVRAHIFPIPLFLLRIAGWFLGRTSAVQGLCGSLQVDISKARNLLGWSPVISVEEGLQRAVKGITKL
jgi:nucleoside-diphosphate-sugar epimerase